jgi:hypothetical protein
MAAKPIFSKEEKAMFARALEDKFQKTGLSDLLKQNSEIPNNRLDEEFFRKMANGYHLEKDNALLGI